MVLKPVSATAVDNPGEAAAVIDGSPTTDWHSQFYIGKEGGLFEKNGLDVTRLLRRESPDTKIVILTMHFAEEVARECLRAGARAYVVKSDSNDEVLAAVRAVRDSRAFFTPQIKDLYYTGYMDCVPNAPPGADGEIPIDRLTSREREVVKLLCEGMSNKEVAYSVGISTRTVESHRNNVMRKLNLEAFSQLIRYAIRQGVVTA